MLWWFFRLGRPFPAIADKTAKLLADNASNTIEGKKVWNYLLNETAQQKVDSLLDDIKSAHPAIDINYIYCNKTGRKIAKREKAEMELMLKVHDVATVHELVKYINLSSGCSPVWLRTDSASLDRLQKVDPHGYFVYAAGLVCSRIHNAHSKTKGFTDPEALREHNKSLAIGFERLQTLPVEKIIETNNLWKKMLALYYPSAIKWPINNVADYCTLQGIDFLTAHAEAKIQQVLSALDNFENMASCSVVDVLKANGGGDGCSQFIRQHHLNATTIDEQVATILQTTGVMLQLTPGGKVVVNKKQKLFIGKSALADKVQSTEKKTHTVKKGFKFQINRGCPPSAG